MLLLHTTAMCESPEEAERVLAPLAACPLAGRDDRPRSRADDDRAGERRPGAAEPRRSPLRGRLHMDRRARGRAGAAPAGAVVRAADRALVLDLVRMGAEPSAARHGVLGRGPRLPGDLRDLVRSRTGRAPSRRGSSATPPGLATLGKGVYLGDTDFTRRPDRFLSDQHFARLQQIRARRDPDGRFCSYLIAEGEELNAEPDRRRHTASGP